MADLFAQVLKSAAVLAVIGIYAYLLFVMTAVAVGFGNNPARAVLGALVFFGGLALPIYAFARLR